MTPNQIIEQIGLSVEFKFVPFSKSRNRDNKERKSLNWSVSLFKDGREVLTTDYTAGCAHCPSYKSGPITMDDADAIDSECETGRKSMRHGGRVVPSMALIDTPTALDVIWSLVMDYSVLDYTDFESWAGDYGYNEDSRNDEKLYNECLALALKLRNGIGDANMALLQEALEDY